MRSRELEVFSCPHKAHKQPHIILLQLPHELRSKLKGRYKGDYIGDYYRGIKGDTRSLDYSSHNLHVVSSHFLNPGIFHEMKQ